MVRLVNVCKSFGRQAVLKNISLTVPRGKIIVILGPSGCGKSVLLKHMIGLLKPDSGEVWFEQTRIDPISESKLGRIRQRFGFLFQNSALFDSLTVGENVGFPLEVHTDLDAEARHERIINVLSQVGLEDIDAKMPAELSGGQRKRVALARAIILEPSVILYDEPTTGLDPIRAAVINELIVKLQTDLQVTSVVVTHDLTSAFRVADQMVMLYDGQVVLTGSPSDFRSSDLPMVRRFMQGEATPEELGSLTKSRNESSMPAQGK